MKPERRGEKPRTITLIDLVERARARLVRPVWDLLARGFWCREQRRRLRLPGASVVWVRGATVPWAEWGGRHGYFEVERVNHLAYLRALGAPVV
jgi:hypothetical protein